MIPTLTLLTQKFMREAMVKKMHVQKIDRSDKSLILGGMIVLLKDKHLQKLKLTTDGSDVRVYQCKPRTKWMQILSFTCSSKTVS